MPFGPVMCEGVDTQIEVDTDFDVLWSDGQTGSSIFIDTPGNYSATITTPCGTTVQTNTITMVSINLEPPTVEDVNINSTTTTFNIDLEVPSGAITLYWYLEEDDEDAIFLGNSIFLSSQMADDIIYVSALYFGPNNSQCLSERVPLNIFFTSTEELERELGLKVYPNPTKEYLFVELDNIQAIDEINFYNFLGKKVQQTYAELAGSIRMDVAALDSVHSIHILNRA